MVSRPSPPSVLRFSQPLDGLLPKTPYGLVSSRRHVQALPSKVFPSPGAVSARRRHLALLWLPRAILLLRGDVARSSASGPCSPGESVAFASRLSKASARYPLGLSPLQGLPHFGRRLHFYNLPLTSLLHRTCETWLQCPSGSSRAEGWDPLSRESQPS